MENKREIGKKIKNKRLQLNLRGEDVAKAVSISRSTLIAIEKGDANYSIDTFLNLMNFLDMRFTIDNQENSVKKRATRLNKIIDKKINRFIIMCVEQYASSINESSKNTYLKLSDAGIIDELKEDYEDMHGMSVYSINEYISKRLGREIEWFYIMDLMLK